jgi:hypothetical protein
MILVSFFFFLFEDHWWVLQYIDQFLSTYTMVGVVGGVWEQRNTNFMIANVSDQQPTSLLQAKHPNSKGVWTDGSETARVTEQRS